jgi:hypothetical protein
MSAEQAGEAVQRPAGWVSVDERLPAPETDVLCQREFGGAIYPPIVAGLFDGDWYTFDEPDHHVRRGAVTHWMELPPAASGNPATEETK